MTLMVWIIVAVALAVVEIATVGFFFMFFAFGALITAFATVLTDDLNIQLMVFLGSSVILLLFGRPILKRMFNLSDNPVASNASKLVGEPVLVLEPVTRYSGRVRVLHSGESWSAYLADGLSENCSELPTGAEGLVKAVDGAKLVVEPAHARVQT